MRGLSGILVVLLVAIVWLTPIVICAQKDKVGLAIIGLLLPPLWPVAVVGALAVAKPYSTWATRHYDPDGPLMELARRRFPRPPPTAPGGHAA